MSRETDSDDHYHLNGELPGDIPDNLKEFLVEDEEGLTYEEVVLQQACVFESYQENGTSMVMNVNDSDDSDDDDDHIHICDSTSSEDEGESSSYQETETNRVVVVVHDPDHDDDDDDDDDDDHIHIHDSSSSEEDEGESSRDGSVNSQEALDEAFARSLQELGEEFDEFFIAEFNAGPGLNREEDVDTDNMRYEELVNLTEAVGVEAIGLSAVQISQLPVSIYTSKRFSSTDEETCAICQENFKFGKQIITLPCVHLYHKKCIIKWLKLKKNCPMCQKEVV